MKLLSLNVENGRCIHKAETAGLRDESVCPTMRRACGAGAFACQPISLQLLPVRGWGLSRKRLSARKAAIEFGAGLNVLYGPNDLGESSLAAAIRAAAPEGTVVRQALHHLHCNVQEERQ
ncbi:MAG: hypothetical protein ACLQU1_44155 [Bryobacteraceae bacterium]